MSAFGHNVTSDSIGCPALPGRGWTEALQGWADHVFNNHGGGELLLPAGMYKVSAPIVLRGTTSIRGEFMATVLEAVGDTTVLKFTGTRHAFRDVLVVGCKDWSATRPTVYVGNNVCLHMADVTIWHGATALEMHGNDGRIRDSFLWGHQSCMQNHGNNWYFGVKFDDCGVIRL